MIVEEWLFKKLANGKELSKTALNRECSNRIKLDNAITELARKELLYVINDKIVPIFDYCVLDKDLIIEGLNKEVVNKIVIATKYATQSTNEDAKNCQEKTFAIISEMQSQGRGRQGKYWQSPVVKNLYFSMKLTFSKQQLGKLSGLSLRIGIIVAKLLRSYGISAQVKWPNDIWVGGDKIAGILIENQLNSKEVTTIIGIGINIYKDSVNVIEGNQITNCEEQLGFVINRNELVANLINALWFFRKDIEEDRVEQLIDQWVKYSVFLNKKIRIKNTSSVEDEIIGYEIGVNEEGALLVLENETHQVHEITSSELSLRPF